MVLCRNVFKNLGSAFVLHNPSEGSSGKVASAGELAIQSIGKTSLALPDDFVQRVGAMIQPGDSAIYAILRVGSPDVVADQFGGYGGKILRTTLSRNQQAKVEKILSTSAR
jgi:uncharacterized membrane protein